MREGEALGVVSVPIWIGGPWAHRTSSRQLLQIMGAVEAGLLAGSLAAGRSPRYCCLLLVSGLDLRQSTVVKPPISVHGEVAGVCLGCGDAPVEKRTH